MEIDFLKPTEFLKATETAHVGNICIHHARGEVGCFSEALIKIVLQKFFTEWFLILVSTLIINSTFLFRFNCFFIKS